MNNTNEDWFRGDNWDEKTQEFFEQKLKRARGSYSKSQYLKIKANYLLTSSNLNKQLEGYKLMERVISDYPTEISFVMFAFERLGDYNLLVNQFDKAETYYRECVSLYKKKGRSGTSGIADVKLAEVIFDTVQSKKYTEMYVLLIDDFANTGGSLILFEDKFRYNLILAKISDSLMKNIESKKYAEKALKLSDLKTSQFQKYPDLGIVKTNNRDLNILNNILEKTYNSPPA